MIIVSFNVNGIRARLHQLEYIIKNIQPTIIGLQEVKVEDSKFPSDFFVDLGYRSYFYGQKSHYGVAIISKVDLTNLQYGLPNQGPDQQRRMISARLNTTSKPINIVNAYFPQGENLNHPTKFPIKQKFYSDIIDYLKTMNKEEHLLLMGDFNISPQDIDIGIGEENRKRWLRTNKCSFTPIERSMFKDLMSIGFIDSFRLHNKNAKQYSWFDYRSRGIVHNRGLRIDLILVSASLLPYCQNAGVDYDIRRMLKPSDHAPVWAKFDLAVSNIK